MVDALKPYNPIFVFDRCEPVKNVNYILNREGDGFLAGKCRDLGAAGIDDDILFLDGDKIPMGDIVKDIENLKSKYDCICYGLEPEYENSELRYFMHNIDSDGILPFQSENKQFAYGCYSCGIWLSKEAIHKLRELNNGRIFHSAFDGTWGDEDNFVGDELYYSGFRIGYSTHVRLIGVFSDYRTKLMDLVRNFHKRIDLRKELFGVS